MTWTETHRRWQALREVGEHLEAQAAHGQPPALLWNDDLADVFGTPEALVAALRYRWQLTYRAQLDGQLSEAALEEQRRRLLRRTRGVRRLLDALDRADRADRVDRADREWVA